VGFQYELLGDFLDLPELRATLGTASHVAAGRLQELCEITDATAIPEVTGFAGVDLPPAPSAETLRNTLGVYLEELIQGEPQWDDGLGAFVVAYSTDDEPERPLYVGIGEGQDFVEVQMPLLESVDPGDRSFSELVELNSRVPFGKFSLVGGGLLVAEQELLAATLDQPELVNTMWALVSVADNWAEFVESKIGQGRFPQGPKPRSNAIQAAGTTLGLRIRIGEAIDGYELMDELGQGAFGTVYRAADPDLPRMVAMKVLLPSAVPDPEAQERFLREARIAAAVQHPNLVNIFGLGTVEASSSLEVPYIVYELVEGESLEDLLSIEASLPQERTAAIVSQVAAAAQELHGQGVVHRDIKPSNVMLWRPRTPDEQAKLIDLGVAFDPAADIITETAMVPGTIIYQPPEASMGTDSGPYLDQWALAVTTYELLAGWHPFDQDQDPLPLVLRRIAEEDPVPLAEMGIASQEVSAVLDKALSKQFEARFPDIRSFAEALTAAVHGSRSPGLGSPRDTDETEHIDISDFATWNAHELPDPVDARLSDVTDGLAEIVEAEGPVICERAYRLYIRASGRHQLTKRVENRLSRALRTLIAEGRLLAEQEFDQQYVLWRILRTPDQNEVLPRDSGHAASITFRPGRSRL
jgi:serine/threonine protein kinase